MSNCNLVRSPAIFVYPVGVETEDTAKWKVSRIAKVIVIPLG